MVGVPVGAPCRDDAVGGTQYTTQGTAPSRRTVRRLRCRATASHGIRVVAACPSRVQTVRDRCRRVRPADPPGCARPGRASDWQRSTQRSRRRRQRSFERDQHRPGEDPSATTASEDRVLRVLTLPTLSRRSPSWFDKSHRHAIRPMASLASPAKADLQSADESVRKLSQRRQENAHRFCECSVGRTTPDIRRCEAFNVSSAPHCGSAR